MLRTKIQLKTGNRSNVHQCSPFVGSACKTTPQGTWAKRPWRCSCPPRLWWPTLPAGCEPSPFCNQFLYLTKKSHVNLGKLLDLYFCQMSSHVFPHLHPILRHDIWRKCWMVDAMNGPEFQWSLQGFFMFFFLYMAYDYIAISCYFYL